MSVKKIQRRKAKREQARAAKAKAQAEAEARAAAERETAVERTMRRREAAVQRQIVKEFDEAATDLTHVADTAMQEFKDQERRMQVLRNWGQLSEQQYENFVFNTAIRSEWYERLADAAKGFVNMAGRAAADYVNDTLPWFFASEANYSAYLIEGVTGHASFNLVDEQAVRRLALRRPKLLPKLTHNSAKSDKWVEQRLRKELLAGIIRGEKPEKIAARFAQVTHMPRAASLTNARTAITGARNGGHQETLERADAAGIDVMKQWQATLDYRTRDTHQWVDGERCRVNERFANGLLFPGDAYGRPEELYNCRCRLRTIVDGIDPVSRRDNVTGDIIDYITYDEWIATKAKAEGVDISDLLKYRG